MATVDLSPEQVVAMVEQLPPATKLRALALLARGASARREEHQHSVEAALARHARSCGREWATMSEDDRLDMVGDLVHHLRDGR